MFKLGYLAIFILVALVHDISSYLDNGLAQPVVLHVPKSEQLLKRCTITGKPLDLLFVLDSSGSLKEQFDEEKKIVQDILSTVAVHPSYTRIALIQYSGIARTEFDFNTFNSTDRATNQRNAIKAVDGVRFINGITKTGVALQHAKDFLKKENGWRSEVETLLFLVSDGRTFDNPRNLGETVAQQLRSSMDIYAYGTGEYVDISRLIGITGSDDKVFSASTKTVIKKNVADMITFFRKWEGKEECVELPACVPGSDKPVDLLCIVDGSGSLEEESDMQIDFLERLFAPININPKAVQVAWIQYATRPRLEFNFDKYRTNRAVENAVDNIRHMSGSTRTNKALLFANQFLNSADSGRREGVPLVVVVLTDGHSTKPMGDAADKIIETADFLYAVSVQDSRNTDTAELYEVTHDWSTVYMKSNISDFEKKLMSHFSFGCPGLQNDGPENFEPVVQGPVDVKCSQQKVSLAVRTRKPLKGRLYAVGYFDTPGCFVDGGEKTEVLLDIKADTCGINREMTENGYEFVGAVMLQFHPDAVTQVDQILDIDCFHSEPSNINRVGELNSKTPRNCQYRIRKFAPNGCVALEATVGESLYHTWECDTDASQYGFLVHDCEVEGNSDGKVPLSNSLGCSVDDNLFFEPEYLKTGIVQARSPIFRLPTSSHMKFVCKVTICDRLTAECDNMIPPQCALRTKRQAKSKTGLPSFTVESRWITVLDSESAKPQDQSLFCSAFVIA